MEPGETVDGRYRIIEPLGEGGMGAVYVVEHVHMRKRMALKVLHADMKSPEVMARFEREAMAAAHIDHPNVASASDFGHTSDGSLFMVLEYIDGQSLRSALDAGPMPESRALSIAKQIASALAKAHELKIVHRDLKPENVMLVVRDGVESVKVLDFGIAKVATEALVGGDDKSPSSGQVLTQIGAVYGTPEYMPPEQAQGQTVDSRADLYSLGVMIYEMLAGVRPFVADEQVQILMAHVLEAPPPLRTKAPGISAQTDALVHQLLEKSPDARVQTAKEVVQTLDAILGNETPAPVSVASPSSRSVGGGSSAMGLARTQVPEKASPSLKMIARVPAPARRIPAALARLPKPALAAIALAVLGLPIAFIAIGIWVHGSSRAVSSSGSSAAVRPPPKKEDLAPDPDLDKAKQGGSQPLADLWSRFPKDARVGHALVVAYANDKKWADAVRSVTRLVDVDPAMAKDDDVRDACISAVTQGSTADVDVAIDTMEGLGAEGVDMLLDLQGRTTLTAPTRTKLQQSLEKPSVRSHAGAAASITIDLRAAKKCDEKKALLDRAKKDGDSRTLTVLTGLQNRGGCGFLGMKDCWGCLRKDSDLDDAVSALQSRR